MANSFVINARNLSITWSDNANYWRWISVGRTPNGRNAEAAELIRVCWLDISGKFQTRHLTQGTQYEVVFMVKLEDRAYGWDTPVNVKLTLPSGVRVERSVRMGEQVKNRWLEIHAGEFVASPENAGEIGFSMYEHDSTGAWKSGLTVKGVAIRPKYGDTMTFTDLLHIYKFLLCCLLLYAMFFASQWACAWFFRIIAALIVILCYFLS